MAAEHWELSVWTDFRMNGSEGPLSKGKADYVIANGIFWYCLVLYYGIWYYFGIIWHCLVLYYGIWYYFGFFLYCLWNSLVTVLALFGISNILNIFLILFLDGFGLLWFRLLWLILVWFNLTWFWLVWFGLDLDFIGLV